MSDSYLRSGEQTEPGAENSASTGDATSAEFVPYADSLDLGNEARLVPPDELQRRAELNAPAEQRRIAGVVKDFFDHHRAFLA